jgi:flagellar hook-length control protein FliK
LYSEASPANTKSDAVLRSFRKGAESDAVLRSFQEDAESDDVPDTFSDSGETAQEDVKDDAVLRSFIEEGREDYTGRPPGFAAYNARPAAMSDGLRGFVKEELRRRGVSDDATDRLDALAASGRPMTVSAVFGALSGNTRASASLTEDESNILKGLLAKLGIDADGQAEILAMSDAGNVNGMWNRVSAALADHKDGLGIGGQEFFVLLRGLDISPGTATSLARRFEERESAGFTGESLGELLAPVEKELADRAAASRDAARHIRGAVDEAVRRARAGKRFELIEDARGNRLSEQSEVLMHDSVRRRTGVDDIADSGRDEKESGDHRGDRVGRSEDLPGAVREKTEAQSDLSSGREKEKTASHSTPRAASPEKAQTPPADGVFINAVVSGGEAVSGRNRLPTARAETYSAEIFDQVESGLLQGALNGARRLTLQLNPEELGSVTVMLSFHQGELRADIRAERAESAELIARHMAELKASLEDQGIRVAELDVRASVSDNGFAGTWDESGEHNLMRDAGERDRLMRLARLRREEAEEAATAPDRHRENGGGLHLVA